MGLDICVYRLIKATDANKESYKYNYMRLIDEDTGEYSDCGFPDWALKLKTEYTEQWYDWDLYEKQTGINIEDLEYKDLECVEFDENLNEVCVFTYEDKNGNIIEIPEASVPLYDKNLFIIVGEEVGYQRDGFNNKFYEDYEAGKIGDYVWSKKELERYKEDYCEGIIKFSFGNTLYTIDIKKYFQEHIIDNFVEGECCVCFSW